MPASSGESRFSLGDIRFPVPASHKRSPRDSSMNLKRLGPSAVDIQNHLYISFLEGSTADVALRVHGSWDAIYNLHRVVLIQSGFFRSLFTAGFIESSPRLGVQKGPDEIAIHFDDPNITRAAFEVCISRLYGGGPPLDISPFLVPSMSQPLTPSFPFEAQIHKTPSEHHPATPRFLLSLLATAVYLSIPSLASQALSFILSTVGPHTVLKYLNFALGKHIGLLEMEPGEPEAATGLEKVAHIIEEEKSIRGTTKSDITSLLGDMDIKSEGPSTARASTSSLHYDSSDEEENDMAEPPIHYGAISDKIGEACACWLARWGTDLLPYEETMDERNVRIGRSTSFASRKRSKTVPSPSTSKNELLQDDGIFPLIWSCGGLNAKWVTAIISADTFFVKGERERYAFARRVVELRRKRGIIIAEEQEWVTLFQHGIHYANMSMEETMQISQDISPTTKQPFVPLSTLQAAHWTQSVLRHHITVRPQSTASHLLTPPGTPLSTSSPRDKELGITLTTADILASISSANESTKDKHYFPVPVDSSVRIGDNGSKFSGASDGGSLSMDQLFTSTSNLSPPPPSSPTSKPNTINSTPLTSESEFFGLLPPRHTALSAVASDPSGKSRWSPYPPYRFAVEFWDLNSLKEKSRLHSHTVWYAGSLFNVYVQVVRKKSQVQLGIYVQRQSSIDPIPASSAPASNGNRNGEQSPTSPSGIVGSSSQRPAHNRGPSLPSTLFPPITQTTSHYSPSIHPSSRSTTPSNTSTSPSSSLVSGFPSNSSASTTRLNTFPATALPVTPPQPYRDPRPAVSVYFTISCASGTGSSQTRFTSSPDVFSVSQSWGWKSSSLRTEEYMDVREEVEGDNGRVALNPQSSLRATILLGVV